MHSRSQRPHSFWSATRIATSGRGLVQHRMSAIHGLSVKSEKSNWLRIRNKNSAHAQKFVSDQRRFFASCGN